MSRNIPLFQSSHVLWKIVVEGTIAKRPFIIVTVTNGCTIKVPFNDIAHPPLLNEMLLYAVVGSPIKFMFGVHIPKRTSRVLAIKTFVVIFHDKSQFLIRMNV